MLPKVMPGDHILTFNWGKIGKNDLVVFRSDVREGKYLVKRVDIVKGDKIFASALNKKLSRQEYKIDTRNVIGKVAFKY